MDKSNPSVSDHVHKQRTEAPRSSMELMEAILASKMDSALRLISRTDSTDSTDDTSSADRPCQHVCRCDDCLLELNDGDLSSVSCPSSPASTNSAPSTPVSPCPSMNNCLGHVGELVRGLESHQRDLASTNMTNKCGAGKQRCCKSSLLGPRLSAPVMVRTKSSGWKTVRNIVHLAPFFQTYKKQRYPWVQLAGHQGNFKSGQEQGTILKKLCGEEERCLQILSNEDALKSFVPEYKGRFLGEDGETYLILQDLLAEFTNPSVMDCKMGVRTYLEEELAKAREKPKLRKDMYEKMCQIDSDAPSKEEHDAKAVTKPRYMVWRETISSTATLGFRIDGIKKSEGESSKDFKTTRTKAQVKSAIESFVKGFPKALKEHLQRLRDIKRALSESKFFAEHELIGSSLLFVHDATKSGIWLIDFAKTFPVPPEMKITHFSPWVAGNHEDGYLVGLENLLAIFSEMSSASLNNNCCDDA